MVNICADKADINENVVFASFMRRVAAFFLDMMTLIIINTVIGMIVLFTIQTFFGVDSNRPDIIAITGIGVLAVCYVMYFSLGESVICQYTIGKKITKIQVVNVDGSKLSFKKATVRTLVKYISVFAFLGYILIFFTSKKQALHDYILGTVVVRV